jgi:hypothetical protein
MMLSAVMLFSPLSSLPEPMGDTLDRIKLDLVAAFRESRDVDILALSDRFPDFSAELLDFWLWLTVAGAPADVDGGGPGPLKLPLSADARAAYERAIHNSCMAVTFGSAWLEPSAEVNCDSLAVELQAVRNSPRRATKAPMAFRKAAIASWIVSRLEPRRPAVSRLAVQKVCYLLEHALDLGIFLDHSKKPLGPYDHRARYSDAEPIAIKKGWIDVRGSVFRAAAENPVGVKYANGYLRSTGAAVQFVEALAGMSDSELETLATVHWISVELAKKCHVVNPRQVFLQLKESPEWKSKLTKHNFSETRVVRSLAFLKQMRIVSLEG